MLPRDVENIPNHDYIMLRRYYEQFGIGEEASFLRSGTMVSTLISVASSFGGKSTNYRPDEIYPQLLRNEDVGADKDWRNMTQKMQTQLVASGVFTEEGKRVV
jgi:hypothetical protein